MIPLSGVGDAGVAGDEVKEITVIAPITTTANATRMNSHVFEFSNG